MFGQHVGDDVEDGLALEETLVGAQPEALQLGLDHSGETGVAKVGISLLVQAVDGTHWGRAPDGEQHGQVKHAVEVDGGVWTD